MEMRSRRCKLCKTRPDEDVKIRAEEHSVMQAINRQAAHYNYHLDKIVLLARHYAGANWKSLTVPKKQIKEFNAEWLLAGNRNAERENRIRAQRWQSARRPLEPEGWY